MATPQKYISVFTGAEIDQAISEMRGALSASLIVNDFTTGGAGKIASAELAKILKQQVDANNLPANIKAQLLSVPNTKVLTDAEYARLNYLTSTTAFRGGFTNAASRAAALTSEYVGYTGNEVTFLVDDGSGDSLSEFSRWDIPSSSWKKIKLYNEGGTTPQVVATASTITLLTFRKDRYNTMKALVSVQNSGATSRQVQEVLITFIGADTYISVYNEVGNATNLFTLGSSISGDFVNLTVTTLSANLTVTGKMIAML